MKHYIHLSSLGLVLTWVGLAEGVRKYTQAQTPTYVNDFAALISKSYTMVDMQAPPELQAECANIPKLDFPPGMVVVSSTRSTISSSEVQDQCGTANTCVIEGLTLQMDSSLKVHSLIVRNGGKFLWTDGTHPSTEDHIWLCAGYVAMEVGGAFTLKLQEASKHAWIYITNNGATHPSLRTRSFGAVGTKDDSDDQPMIDIQGRELDRTWSLLETPLVEGSSKLKLLHHPLHMGWQLNDRIAIAPTKDEASGEGQSFFIDDIEEDGTILLSGPSTFDHDAKAYLSPAGGEAVLQSAEVVNLSRNVVMTGDDFEEVQCDPTLPEAILGTQTSALGCRCATFRDSCTVGLHTIHMLGGSSRIENTRVEKCGQRGIEGKYCLHFHQLEACPDCLFRNNAVEASQQRGLIVHGTHLSTAETNVFYDVRGASLYIEDGNEVGNTLAYNVAICPWKFSDGGCTVPGTSNDQADTSLNQAGLYSVAPTNNLIGNRMANHFNGMFLEVNGVGRGPAYNEVCTRNTPIGRIEGNVFHSNGRFGTYILNNFPLHETGQSVAQNGFTTSCEAFTPTGEDNGYSTAIRNNLDYGNAFVGHYNVGDIQYNHHTSTNNLNLIYWKETKVFADGCSAHIRNSFFQGGTMALPDSLGSFIVEGTTIQDVMLEANHHCTVGTTGFLCMPLYVLHNVTWVEHARKWVTFVAENNMNNGGIFSLSPADANANMVDSGRDFFLPPGYISLVSSRFPYLLDTGKCDSSESLGLGNRYENGILCRSPLRVLKIFTKDLEEGSAPNLVVEVDSGSSGELISTFSIPVHITNTKKQGFVLPVIPGSDFSYRFRLDTGDIPVEWVIDFGDMAVSNRWGVEELRLEVQGRECPSVVKSDHDRRFVAANSEELLGDSSWGHGACSSYPSMPLTVCVDDGKEHELLPLECPDLCGRDDCGTGGYCDCYLQRCMCKPGWIGEACEVDACAVEQCLHGSCAARFLGSDVPVSDLPCICEDGWAGAKCDISPCEGVDCGDYGKCKALSETDAVCECEAGWNGAKCDESCDDRCFGTYPYGCKTEDDDVVNFICGPSKNQCHYTKSQNDSGPNGWCTFKSSTELPLNPLEPSPVSKPTTSPTLSPLTTEAPISSQVACTDHCKGNWPFSCAQDLPNIVNYMCHSQGGCYYAKTREDQAPYAGFCVYKGLDIASSPFAPTVAPATAEAPELSPVTTKPTISPTLSPVTAEAPIPSQPACTGHCRGNWPFGCAHDLTNIVNYMCHSAGGCYYAKTREDQGPYDGFCVYKGIDSST